MDGASQYRRTHDSAVGEPTRRSCRHWGSDTCGYTQPLLEQEVCARWLAFSAFTPIMEVGPTRNVGFWNLPREPQYDSTLIAMWRLYARVHQRLADAAVVERTKLNALTIPRLANNSRHKLRKRERVAPGHRQVLDFLLIDHRAA